ncbi:MAG: hypothetical protein HY314_17450 [Acidobacteria bacterium]|nr:hypothetical protein [Acidobacteriota bacterium]
MSKVLETKEVICKICGKPLEIIEFGEADDRMVDYVHPKCAEPLAVGSTAPSPRPFSDLLKLAEDTIAYARRALPVEVEPDLAHAEQSGKYLVLLGFAHKMLKSTEAVTLLCRNGYGEDAAIVTRSIVEAVIHAGRIESLPPEEGAKRWGAYMIALQWRLYLRWKKLLEDDPEQLEQVFTPESVQKHKDEFTEELQDWFIIDRGTGLNDPGNISKTWLTRRTAEGKLKQEDIYEMARKLDGIEQQRRKLGKYDGYRTLVQTAYDFGSNYAHSNTLAVEKYSIKTEDGNFTFQSLPSKRYVSHSLWSTIGGLIQMLHIVNRVNPLEDGEELASLSKRWCQVIED